VTAKLSPRRLADRGAGVGILAFAGLLGYRTLRS